MDFERLSVPRQRLERGLGLSAGRHVRLQQSGLFADLGGGRGNARGYTVSEVVSLAAALDLADLGASNKDVVKIATARSAYAAGLEGENELVLAAQGRGYLSRVPSFYSGPRVVLPLAEPFRRGVNIVLVHALDVDSRAETELVRAAFGEYINGLRRANAPLADAIQAAS